jgi:hypothetical protein
MLAADLPAGGGPARAVTLYQNGVAQRAARL